MVDYLLLTLAAFTAGVLNTVAGGGTFLTFPALIFVGVPAVAANATSAVSVFPGYLGGAVGFRGELAKFDFSMLWKMTALTALGGLVGSLLLLVSSDGAFSAVVPFLLMFATFAFAFGDKIQKLMKSSASGVNRKSPSIALASVYGGYFNGGLGILLLALFSLWGMRDIHAMNGLKNWLSFVLSAISVGTFTLAGLVAWPEALVMMVAATAGGYLGAPIARAMPQSLVRAIVIAVGSSMSAIFFARLLL